MTSKHRTARGTDTDRQTDKLTQTHHKRNQVNGEGEKVEEVDHVMMMRNLFKRKSRKLKR